MNIPDRIISHMELRRGTGERGAGVTKTSDIPMVPANISDLAEKFGPVWSTSRS